MRLCIGKLYFYLFWRVRLCIGRYYFDLFLILRLCIGPGCAIYVSGADGVRAALFVCSVSILTYSTHCFVGIAPLAVFCAHFYVEFLFFIIINLLKQ